MKQLVLLAVCTIACASGPSLDRAILGSLEYAVPSGWSSVDRSTHQRAMVEWSPLDENERKESIAIVRVERAALAKDNRQIDRLLRDAQASLPRGKFTAPVRFSTKYGLAAVRIDGDFIPPGQQHAYRRMHAVVAVGRSLVHVIYTARELDRDVFDTVVESLHRTGEG